MDEEVSEEELMEAEVEAMEEEWLEEETLEEETLVMEEAVNEDFICPECRASFGSDALLIAHSVRHTQSAESYDDGSTHLVRCVVTSMNGLARDYRLWSDAQVTNISEWMRAQYGVVQQCLSRLMQVFVVRAMMYVCVNFVQTDPTTGEVIRRSERYIPSRRSEHIVDLFDWYENHIERIACTLNKCLNTEGSDWQLEGLKFVLLKVSLSENLSGSGSFKTPAKLAKMRAVVNVNCEEKCFLYAVLSILHYDDIRQNRSRASKYRPWLNELNFKDLDVNNMNIRGDIPKFEKMNNLKINVHVWENGLKGIRYNNPVSTAPRTVNLLLIHGENGRWHYCGITKLSRLYRHLKKSHNMPYTCERCIQSFKSNDTFRTHYEWCRRGKAQIEAMPKERDYQYTNLGHELSPLRVIYADIECYIDPQLEAHVPYALGMYDVFHPEYNCQNSYRSWCEEDCVIKFLNELECLAKDQYEHNIMTRRKMIITPQQQADFRSCKSCPKCKRDFTEKLYKVRDHCHITGLYRGPLCSKCNLRLSLKRYMLPVFFHNLKNYDCHMILKHGISKFKHWKLHCIAQTAEKFMTVNVQIPVGITNKGKTIYFKICFLDSFQFMSRGLDDLAKNLTSLPVTEKLRKAIPTLSMEVVRRKGVFPYSYFSSPAVLNETSLPSIEHFKNDLTKKECSKEDYAHAERAWKEFQCQTFKDYTLRYLELDVRILTDVFEDFRRMSLRQDGLDPVHFVSLPGLSYMSAFKMTGEKIHLLQDPFIYNLFERGIKGGLTFVNTHHAKDHIFEVGNKKYRQILMYIDMNNLYGAAMTECLPHSNFKLLTKEEIQNIFPTSQKILDMDTETDVGFYFEVDLHYPTAIHNKTADFPLAPELAQVTEDMLSPYMKKLYKNLMIQRHKATQRKDEIKRKKEVKKQFRFKSSWKLLLAQNDKINYCVHFKLLKYYLQQGMQLKKIHNVVQFTQKPFLRPYIEFNSRQRSLAQSKADKDFFKYKNNSLFGKTMEDVRKHGNYKLVTDVEQFKRLSTSPLYVDRDIITDGLTGVKMHKAKVILNRPIFVGQAVLEHSKLAMYNLFYKILPSCPLIHKLKLLGGDTDSFFLQVTVDYDKTPGDVLYNMKHIVDFSNYSPTHPLYSIDNKARLGCFKDEVAGQEIEEMILLRPKMYSMKMKGDDEEKNSIRKAKGVGGSVTKNLRHTNYQEAYHQNKESTVDMTILKSISHTVYTYSFQKQGLSCWDDKRIWLNKNKSLPHGHVDSPVQYQKRICKIPPPSGDVCNEEHVRCVTKRRNDDDDDSPVVPMKYYKTE